MTKGKYSFLRDENGEPYAYKCVCGKVTSLKEIELARIDFKLDELQCPHCYKRACKIPVPLPEFLKTKFFR